jgi:ferrochelatase
MQNNSNTSPVAAILVNLGTPATATPEGVREFLARFLRDPRVVDLPRWFWLPILYGIILRVRPKKVAQLYRNIWTADGSPILAITKKLTQAVASALAMHYGERVLTQYAMCYSEPHLPAVLQQLYQRGVRRFVLLPLYPQYSATTTAVVYDQFHTFARAKPDLPEVRLIKSYAEHPLYIQALALCIEKHFAKHGTPQRFLFSFHGIPERNVQLGDPYQQACVATAQAVAKLLQWPDDFWLLTYQSRFGYAKWLTPYTDETLRMWGANGVHSVAVISPGFAVDCLETLEELSIQNRDFFLQAGGQSYHYIPALNDELAHVALMCQLLNDECRGWI